jgi:hypothetical protein
MNDCGPNLMFLNATWQILKVCFYITAPKERKESWGSENTEEKGGDEKLNLRVHHTCRLFDLLRGWELRKSWSTSP